MRPLQKLTEEFDPDPHINREVTRVFRYPSSRLIVEGLNVSGCIGASRGLLPPAPAASVDRSGGVVR